MALVRSADQLAGALSVTKADIILAGFSDATSIGASVLPYPSGPVVLPVIDLATKTQIAACQQKLPCHLQRSDKPEKFVVVVNATMNDRVKARAQAARHGNGN